MVFSRVFMVMAAFGVLPWQTLGQANDGFDAAAVDARLNQLYKSCLTGLAPQGQESLKEAERAWIVFTQKSGQALVTLRHSGALTEEQLMRIFLNEERNRCDQLQTFFVSGQFQEEDSRTGRERAEKELQNTYDRCLQRLSSQDQNLLREAQRAWLVFRDADADASVMAARQANRGWFRGFAAKAHSATLRANQLRSIYLESSGPPLEQLVVATVKSAPPPDYEITTLAQLQKEAQSKLKAFLAQKEAPFFGKAETIKKLPELPTDLSEQLRELDVKFNRFNGRSDTAKLFEPVLNEYLAVELLTTWSSFTQQMKSGDVQKGTDALNDVLRRKPAVVSPDFVSIWQAAQSWQPIYTKAAADYEEHVKKAQSLAALGKNGAAIQEYEAAYDLIENATTLQEIKKLREQSLGL